MAKLVGGAGVPAAGSGPIIAALNDVASNFGLDAAAIAAIIDTESKWDTRCVTGKYIGLTQVGPELPQLLNLTRSEFLGLSAAQQIAAYGRWLNYYKFTEQLKKHGMKLSTQPVERQAAVLQAMQFSPNGAKWKIAFAKGDYSVPSTSAKQAKVLGDTSIGDMEDYYRSFLAKHPAHYDSGMPVLAAVVGTGAAGLAAALAATAKIVATEGLNVRSTPDADGEKNILGQLDYGDEVVVTSQPSGAGFVAATVSLEGDVRDGFVHSRYLRTKEVDKIEEAVRRAVVEWRRFDKGNGIEYVEPYSSFIQEYWAARGRSKLTGKDRDQFWSAVFISFVLEKAGYQRTQFDIRHATYIHEAIQNRVTGVDGDFWGYRIDEAKPEVGDIICQWRGAHETTYDLAEIKSDFESHTDLVVAVRDRAIVTLGGNVANAVSRGEGVTVETKTFELSKDGYLSGARNVFALMKNRHRT